MKKRIVFIMVFMIIIGLLSGCSEKQETITVTTGNISDIITETGIIASNSDYSITAQVGGNVIKCNFEEDDYVEEGSLLYTIDSVDLNNQIET